LVYIQVSKGTFIELQTINAQRPTGIYHFGVVVDDMAQATAMWKSRGADVREITPSSGTKAILSNIYDPNSVRMELLQLPPESLHAQATNRWIVSSEQHAKIREMLHGEINERLAEQVESFGLPISELLTLTNVSFSISVGQVIPEKGPALRT
jgi:hypothetical protein